MNNEHRIYRKVGKVPTQQKGPTQRRPKGLENFPASGTIIVSLPYTSYRNDTSFDTHAVFRILYDSETESGLASFTVSGRFTDHGDL